MLKLALQNCSEKWTIHGLWYDYNNGTYPSYCDDTINFKDIPLDLNEKMNNYWISCEGSKKSFWNHELKKHASCIKEYLLPELTSTDYFNITVGLYMSFMPLINKLCQNYLSENCEISFISN